MLHPDYFCRSVSVDLMREFSETSDAESIVENLSEAFPDVHIPSVDFMAEILKKMEDEDVEISLWDHVEREIQPVLPRTRRVAQSYLTNPLMKSERQNSRDEL